MIWSLAPWRRAPLLLWRRWSVAVVLAAAAMLLAAAAAAGPLFVSSAASATLAQQLANQCQQGAAVRVAGVDLFDDSQGSADPVAADLFDLNGRVRVAEVGAPAHVGPPVRKVYAQHVRVTAATASRAAPFSWVTVISKTGATEHVAGAVVVVATHDPVGVEFADRVLLMSDGALTERA